MSQISVWGWFLEGFWRGFGKVWEVKNMLGKKLQNKRPGHKTTRIYFGAHPSIGGDSGSILERFREGLGGLLRDQSLQFIVLCVLPKAFPNPCKNQGFRLTQNTVQQVSQPLASNLSSRLHESKISKVSSIRKNIDLFDKNYENR